MLLRWDAVNLERASRGSFMQKAARFFSQLSVAWILFDSLLTYFTAVYTGEYRMDERVQVNYIIAFFLCAVMLLGGWRLLLPPAHVIFGLVFLSTGFFIAIMIVPEIPVGQAFSIIGALCAFIAGYSFFRWNEDENALARMFLFIGGLYLIVCLLALLRVAPGMFPTIDSARMEHGVLIYRPEVMTDQNFQVFYFIPLAVVLVLPYRFFRFSIALALSMAAGYVLIKLQTRSGILVFIVLVFMSLVEPIWNRLNRKRRLSTFVLIILCSLYAGSGHVEFFLNESRWMIARFFHADIETGGGRILAFNYLFDNIGKVAYWLPKGNEEFLKQWGTVPHSNITAMYLEGGIAGLSLWILFFLLPILALGWRFFRKRLDRIETLVLFASISVLVVQLSLNVPFFKQVWLWAGASIGALYRSRARIAVESNSVTLYEIPNEEQQDHYWVTK
jgi:hypothetical protein